jgi:hypothetical protein
MVPTEVRIAIHTKDTPIAEAKVFSGLSRILGDREMVKLLSLDPTGSFALSKHLGNLDYDMRIEPKALLILPSLLQEHGDYSNLNWLERQKKDKLMIELSLSNFILVLGHHNVAAKMVVAANSMLESNELKLDGWRVSLYGLSDGIQKMANYLDLGTVWSNGYGTSVKSANDSVKEAIERAPYYGPFGG